LWSVCSFSIGGEQPITWSIRWNSCIGDLYLLIIRGHVSILSKVKIVPWLRWFFSGISIRGTAFSSRPSLVGLWRKKWRRNSLFSYYFDFLVSVSFTSALYLFISLSQTVYNVSSQRQITLLNVWWCIIATVDRKHGQVI